MRRPPFPLSRAYTLDYNTTPLDFKIIESVPFSLLVDFIEPKIYNKYRITSYGGGQFQPSIFINLRGDKV